MRKLTAFVFLVYLAFLPIVGFGQQLERLPIRIIEKGDTLASFGGLDAPQVNELDINLDGLTDWWVFDRTGNISIPLIRNSKAIDFSYQADFATSFPRELAGWVRVKDYNKDGVQDIFTQASEPGISGVNLYKGAISNNKWRFDKVNPKRWRYPVLSYASGSGAQTNIYVAYGDLPAIEDVDGDGDMDILSFDISGGIVNYYKNVSKEQNLPLDSLIYLKEDACWGKFTETSANTILLSEDGESCAGFNTTRHAGSTVTLDDISENGLFDALIGDVSFPNISVLKNTGSAQKAYMTEVSFLEADGSPVLVEDYPAAFVVHPFDDERKAYLVTPNSSPLDDLDNHPLVQEDGESYTLLDKDVFSRIQADFGSYSAPTFVDFNADGIQDIVVGVDYGENRKGRRGRLVLLQGLAGTNSLYKVVNDDLFSLWTDSLSTLGLVPTLGDLDNDGDLDVICGLSNGRLMFVENVSSATGKFERGQVETFYSQIDFGISVAPHLVDLDEDGLVDLLVGRYDGAVSFLKNIGSLSQPDFDADLEATENVARLGLIDIREQGFPFGNAQVSAMKLGGKHYLFVGSYESGVKIYEVSDDFNSAFRLKQGEALGLSDGNYTTVDVSPVGDKLQLVLGNQRGGLSFFSLDTDKVTSQDRVSTDMAQVVIAPNPSRGQIKYTSNHYSTLKMTIFDISGRRRWSKVVSRDEWVHLPLSSGYYQIVLEHKNGAKQNWPLILH